MVFGGTIRAVCKMKKVKLSTTAKVCLATGAFVFAIAVNEARWGPAPCDSTETGFLIKPKVAFGVSVGFAAWTKLSFPVGSCEVDLIAWLDDMGFKAASRGPVELFDSVSMKDLQVAKEMRAAGILMENRALVQPAIIGRSIFEVGWFVDDGNRISAIYARSNLFHWK